MKKRTKISLKTNKISRNTENKVQIVIVIEEMMTVINEEEGGLEKVQ